MSYFITIGDQEYIATTSDGVDYLGREFQRLDKLERGDKIIWQRA